MKVSQFHVKNQFIITDGEKQVFQSYSSIIAVRSGGRVVLGKDWDYSKTTGKYRNMFLGETRAETVKKIRNGIYTIDETL